MSEHRDEAPVIRIVKKVNHGGHHGGAWKVAYADFVTAMMALFIVLWILGQSEEMKQSVAGYFRDPTGKPMIVTSGAPGQQAKMTLQQNAGNSSSVVDMNDDPLRQLEEEADRLKQMIDEQPDLKALAGQISVDVTPEGVRVEINESEKQPLFESGSAHLSPMLIDALGVIAHEYRKLPQSVVIEGHTDSAPYSVGSGMTNWELSTQRATEARRVMADNGLSDTQLLMIRGFADHKPRFDDPADPRNRRISLLLLSPEGLRIALGQNQPPVTNLSKNGGLK
jgi:chemotaxis protein MotB